MRREVPSRIEYFVSRVGRPAGDLLRRYVPELAYEACHLPGQEMFGAEQSKEVVVIG